MHFDNIGVISLRTTYWIPKKYCFVVISKTTELLWCRVDLQVYLSSLAYAI
jgi:hypothetical protein